MKILKQLFTTPVAELGRASRFLVRQCRFWLYSFTLLRKNRAGQLAAALAYYTIFGIVPLAIVVVLIFHSIPSYRATGDQLKKIVYNELRLTQIEYPDPDHPEQSIALTTYVDRVIDRFFTSLDTAPLGVASALLVIWAALRLLSIIEAAFNHMWYVARGRSFIHRVINYWALLTLVPLLLGAGLYATTKYTILARFETSLFAAIGPVLSYLLSMLALFVLYLVMPNAKVRSSAAILGAIVAALVWTLAKWGFGVYVTQLIPYRTTYGVLGLIPLAVLWVYVTWFIVLFGLQLAFVIQHFEMLERAEATKARQVQEHFVANDLTALAMTWEIAAAFEADQGPVSTEEICSRLDIPGEFGEKLLENLVRTGVLAKTTGPRQGFTLARDPEHIKLSDVADALTASAFAQPRPDTHKNLQEIARAQRDFLERHNLKETLDVSTPPVEAPGQLPPEPPAQPTAS
jgi:membrane protein